MVMSAGHPNLGVPVVQSNKFSEVSRATTNKLPLLILSGASRPRMITSTCSCYIVQCNSLVSITEYNLNIR